MMTGLEPVAAVGPPHAAEGWAGPATSGASFGDSLAAAEAQGGASDPAPTSPLSSLLSTFEHLNTEAGDLHTLALQTQNAGQELTPGEMVMLTMRSGEFMFHCELTSNIANRSSDGLQQLFREQG